MNAPAIGQRFGRWTMIAMSPSRMIGGEPRAMVQLRCDCGFETSRAKRHLSDIGHGGCRDCRTNASGHKYYRSLEDRFWSFVNKNGPVVRPELGPCWVWTGSTAQGYGLIYTPMRKRAVRAHRIAVFLSTGRMPPQLVCHRCDNPSCVRIDHLFEGTHSDNVVDMASKGRLNSQSRPKAQFLRGSDIGNSKLTEDDVADMRRAARGGVSKQELAARHGISITTAERAILGYSFAHVAEPPFRLRRLRSDAGIKRGSQ